MKMSLFEHIFLIFEQFRAKIDVLGND